MHLTRTIDIAAPPSTVWAVVSDVERWPEVTSTIKRVELLDGKPLAVGTQARITQPSIPQATWTVTEVRVDGSPTRGFTWSTKNMGMTMVADHQIVPTEAGARLTLVLDATGLSATLLSPIFKPALKRALRIEAERMKQRSEVLARA